MTGWNPIATADRYAQPSLDLYDPVHDTEYGASWDGYWDDADGTDHPETGGSWVAAIWCNSCSTWHATRIAPTHWRERPSAPNSATPRGEIGGEARARALEVLAAHGIRDGFNLPVLPGHIVAVDPDAVIAAMLAFAAATSAPVVGDGRPDDVHDFGDAIDPNAAHNRRKGR